MSEPASPADSALARAFGEQADHYDRMRPDYPPESVEFVLHGRSAGRILDVGAGTGKLTRRLLERAEQVIAVEPDDRMRAVLAAKLPSVEVLAGSAEQLPLPDASVDAIFAGQAFHWFPRPAADRELARVLRPGGVVGLIWNLPDDRVAWVPELRWATRQPTQRPIEEERDLDPALFTPAEHVWTDWSQRLPGLSGLRALLHTWSWVITQTPAEQQAVDERLQVLAGRHAELQAGVLEFPLRTKAIRQYLR